MACIFSHCNVTLSNDDYYNFILLKRTIRRFVDSDRVYNIQYVYCCVDFCSVDVSIFYRPTYTHIIYIVQNIYMFIPWKTYTYCHHVPCVFSLLHVIYVFLFFFFVRAIYYYYGYYIFVKYYFISICLNIAQTMQTNHVG